MNVEVIIIIQYKCDMCGDSGFNKAEICIIDLFPRRVREYAKDAKGVKLIGVDRFDVKETHLCKACSIKIAQSLPILEED